MQLQFDINRSLKANPPKYGKGIKFIERKIGKLSTIRTTDSKGNSLQPREKNIENEQRNTQHSFEVNGVMYDKDVMVTELCNDNIEELVSGYGRTYTFGEMGVDTYFWDLVKFDSPYWKAIWKRKLNAGKDHIAQGTPNTKGTYIKGLVELKNTDSFNHRDDDEIRNALFEMSDGQLNEKQIEELLKKFRKSNSKYIGINAYDKPDANKAASKLGLPTSGYVKDISSSAYSTVGFVYRTGDLQKEIIGWVKHYDYYNQKIKITGYIEHTDLDEEVIKRARIIFLKKLDKTIETMKTYLDTNWHDIIEFQGFLAQITTPDSKQGGKPKERGLVDVSGNIIKE